MVRDRFDTLEELKSAHPIGEPGDAYAVGSEDDNTIYIWSEDLMNWKSVKDQRESPGNKERSARKAIQAPPVRRASRALKAIRESLGRQGQKEMWAQRGHEASKASRALPVRRETLATRVRREIKESKDLKGLLELRGPLVQKGPEENRAHKGSRGRKQSRFR